MTPDSARRLAAIVVTWNSGDHVRACLESLAASTVPVAVVVIDNDSRDGTLRSVEELQMASVTLLRSGGNLGYAGGNNVGLRIATQAGADVAILVNPDATVAPSCLEHMTAALYSSSAAGLVSPMICYAGSDTVWFGGADIDLRTGTSYHDHEGSAYETVPRNPFTTGRASGCVLGVTLDTVALVGLLDERYFLYYEEAEWSLRMRKHSLRSVVVPSARAWHNVGHGRGGARATYQYYMTRNRLLLVSQHGSNGVAAALPQAVRDSLATLVTVARTHPDSLAACAGGMARGYFDFARARYGPAMIREPRSRRSGRRRRFP